MRHENMVAWAPEEDRIILEMYETSGRKWGKIAAELSSRPGGRSRTSASVRNRYLRIEKGQQMRAEGKSKNRCAACGMQKLGHVCTARLNAAQKVTVDTPTAPTPSATPTLFAPGMHRSFVPFAPVADEAAEALTGLSAGAATLVAQVAGEDTRQAEATQASESFLPKKRLAWRKHEEEAAQRMLSPSGADAVPAAEQALSPKTNVMHHQLLTKPVAEAGPVAAHALPAKANVMLLTKQPSGELIMSMYTMTEGHTAAAAL